jgi:hypothetical protein
VPVAAGIEITNVSTRRSCGLGLHSLPANLPLQPLDAILARMIAVRAAKPVVQA